MRDLLAGLRARLRPAPRFTPAPVEPSARELDLAERNAAGVARIDEWLSAYGQSPGVWRNEIDWLLDMREVLAPSTAGSQVLRTSAPAVRGRTS